MYLQLADQGTPAYLGEPVNPLEYMVQIPAQNGGFVWVREDLLDDLSDQELYEILQAQPHLNGMLGLFQKMKARKDERKSERGIKREAGKTSRFDRREGKRQTRMDRKGGGFMERLTGSVKQVVGALPGQGQEYDERSMFPQITGGAEIGVAKWWQNPLVIGGIVVGGGLLTYAVVKSGKK